MSISLPGPHHFERVFSLFKYLISFKKTCFQNIDLFPFFQDTYRFKYVLSDLSKKGTNSSNSSKNTADKTKWEEYEEALRDLKTNWLSKMGM